MSTLRQNPFAWHSSSAHINAPISSLSFSAADDDEELQVKELPEDDQIEIFITQQAPVTRVMSVAVASNIYHIWYLKSEVHLGPCQAHGVSFCVSTAEKC